MTPPAGLEDRLAAALRGMDDQPVDLRAGRSQLNERMRTSRPRWTGRLAVAAVAGLVVAALVVGLGWWRATSDDVTIADRLPSGLPIGRLEGSVFYTDTGMHRQSGRFHFWYVVNPDGTGTFKPPRNDSDNPWPVRFVGRTPGHVRVVRDDLTCGKITDITLDFRVEGNVVTITDARFGECTRWPVMGDLDLTGEKLRWIEDPLAPR